MANTASPPAGSDRPQPLPGGARAILSPVRWGLLAVVAGAHAAGLGLLASGAGEPRSSAAPASALTISVRMIGTERESATKEAVPATTEASVPATVPPAAARVQVRQPEIEALNKTIAAGAEETVPAAAPATAAPAPSARREPEPEAEASARAATKPVIRARPLSPPVSAAAARTPAAKPTAPPVQRPTAAGIPAAGAGEAPHGPAIEPVQPPAHASPAAPASHDSVPAEPPAAAPVAMAAGSQPLAAAAPSLVVAARYDAAYLNNPKPTYPAISRRMGEQGKVLMRVRVMRDGLAQEVEILDSSGSPRLDRAAAEAVRSWRFTPARQGDEAVDSWLRVPIVFRLDD